MNKKKILSVVANGDIATVINFLLDFTYYSDFKHLVEELEDEIHLISSRYQKLEMDNRSGILRYDEYKIQTTIISKDLISIVNSLFVKTVDDGIILSESVNEKVNTRVLINMIRCKIGVESFELNEFTTNLLENDLVGIIGENGSGKTTILDTISNDLKVIGGAIEFNNHLKNGVNNFQFFSKLTTDSDRWVFSIEETLKFICINRSGLSRKESIRLVDYIVHRLNIKYLLSRSFNDLSDGQKAKIEIAKCILSNSLVTLMDEPFAHLDDHARLVIKQDIVELSKRGLLKCLIITSFNYMSISSICNKFLFILRGNVYTISKREITESQFRVVSVESNDNIDLSTLEDIFNFLGSRSWSFYCETISKSIVKIKFLNISSDSLKSCVQALCGKFEFSKLKVDDYSIEDLFTIKMMINEDK